MNVDGLEKVSFSDDEFSGIAVHTPKVFLGGTCNETTWRQRLIPLLDPNEIEYFDPVVEDWTPECKAEEDRQKIRCEYHLYVITPKHTGPYSFAEAVDDSNKQAPGRTIFCYLEEDEGKKMDTGFLKSIDAVAEIITNNGGLVFTDLQSVADTLNRVRCTYYL